MSTVNNDPADEGDAADFTKLLAALSVGARSVNSLPKTSERNEDEDASASENEEDDEFAYHMAFSEYRNLCNDSRAEIASLLNRAFKSSASVEHVVEDFEFDDPQLWETAAEACDCLLERVDQYIQNVKEGRIGQDGEKIGENIAKMSDLARNKAKGGFDQIVGNLVDMEKPQIAYNFAGAVQNARTEPFVPQIHPDKPFSIDQSFKLEPIPGHGLESRQTRGDSEKHVKSIPEDIVAPQEHYPHPYSAEIKALQYRDWQLIVKNKDCGKYGTSGTLNNPELASGKGVWIDNEDDLIQLVKRIHDDDCREIAIDLEAHSFRSFNGFLCLMQLSLRRPVLKDGDKAKSSDDGDSIDTAYDFVIDTLALRNVINEHLAPIMANPNIVKVMHGADSDIGWFQRDFGIYVVNLFDTYRACKCLRLNKASLAYLLVKYANVEADKKHQLSDWRQRPLPVDMRAYAVSDTMYLLDIYDKMRVELLKQGKTNTDVSIRSVLDASKNVCLIRYDKEPFNPNGYKNIIMSKRGRSSTVDLNSEQESLLKALYDWRDLTAREEDESPQYICGNTGLLRIASTCPRTVNELRSCMNPAPPMMIKYSSDILRMVKQLITSAGKSMTPNVKSNSDRNNLTSPFPGTAALYQRAGWTTPQSGLLANEEDGTSSSDVEMKEISTTSYDASMSTSHNLLMKPNLSSNGNSKGVDGLGAAREAMNEGVDGSNVSSGTVTKQNSNAQKAADKVRKTLKSGDQNLLKLGKAKNFTAEGDAVEEHTSDTDEESVDNNENNEIDEIPRSMKEIYRMSNRNRRKTKKIQIEFSDEEDDIEDAEELRKAQEIISKSGVNGGDYFDDSPSKRQRTKSQDGSSTQASNTRGDLELMIDLGWLKNKKEADALLEDQKQSVETGEIGGGKEKSRGGENESNHGSNNNGERKSRQRRGGKGNKSSAAPFDYSKVGAIGVGGSSKIDSNPFFEGAATSRSSATTQQTAATKERKKSSNTRRGGKRNNQSGNKTHTYRK